MLIGQVNSGQMKKRGFMENNKFLMQQNRNTEVSDYIFYRPYRGEKPVFVNNHAEAVMRGMG